MFKLVVPKAAIDDSLLERKEHLWQLLYRQTPIRRLDYLWLARKNTVSHQNAERKYEEHYRNKEVTERRIRLA